MTTLHEIPGTHELHAQAAAVAAATTTAYVAVLTLPFAAVVTEVVYVPYSALTGADTNSMNLNVDSVVAGTPTERGNVDFASGTDAAALTEKVLYSGSLSLAAGAQIAVEREKVGTGLAMPGGEIIVRFRGG